MKKILLSGFGPFLDVKSNPSEALVRQLADSFNLPFVILPVVFGGAFAALKKKAIQEKPDVILMFGVAATRSTICLERIGLNWVESKNPDTSMMTPVTGKIDPKQELALMSSINFEKIFSMMDLNHKEHIEVSYSAGAYVCNDLYFRALNDQQIKAEKLFVHIPPFDQLNMQIQIDLLSKVVQGVLR